MSNVRDVFVNVAEAFEHRKQEVQAAVIERMPALRLVDRSTPESEVGDLFYPIRDGVYFLRDNRELRLVTFYIQDLLHWYQVKRDAERVTSSDRYYIPASQDPVKRLLEAEENLAESEAAWTEYQVMGPIWAAFDQPS